MKVLLLSLPGIEERDGNLFPLGIGYLAAALQPRHEVQARHYRLMSEARHSVPEMLRSFAPQVVGLTCSTFNRGFVREVIPLIRKALPGAKIVVGGVHVTFCHDQILEQYGADVVVIGEGERTLAELCDVLEEGRALEEVRGIAYRSGGAVKVTPPREAIGNLDDLPVPDYSYGAPFMEASGMGFLITSRGCPVRCTFCSTSSFWGQRVRMNSVSRVVDEMEMLVARFGVKKIFFHDDTFNLGIARVKAICAEILARGLKVEWGCSCRVTPISEEMIAAMVEAGCRHICWGIESGSAEMLKKIEKKISLEQIREAYRLCSRFSEVLSTGAFTMVGNPGECEATVRDTVSFLNGVPITDAPSTSILYVLPGTLLYEELKQRGEISDEQWFRHDSVPYYTLENSYRTMMNWARLVQQSGDRIPFPADQHFWAAPRRGEAEAGGGFPAIHRLKALLDAGKVRSLIVKKLPAGRIRF